MSKIFEKTYSIPGPWYHIRNIRRSAKMNLRDLDVHVVEAALLAISELGENALRHGIDVPEHPKVEIEVFADENTISIRVTNGFDRRKHYRRVIDHVSRLHMAADPMEVYIERLQEIKNNAGHSGGMGLYRVAAEGFFTIKADASENVLTITAERDAKAGE